MQDQESLGFAAERQASTLEVQERNTYEGQLMVVDLPRPCESSRT